MCVMLCLALGTAHISPLLFVDRTDTSRLHFRHHNSKTPRKYLPETMGGGVAILDFDRDGWMDVFFVNGAKLAFPHPEGAEPDKSSPEFWNRLFRNNGDGTFTDVTIEYGIRGRGYGMGVAVGDYDNDGYPDLFVTNLGTGGLQSSILYRNGQGKRFIDVTAQSGIQTQGWTTSAGFFDYDQDGHLDLFVCRYVKWRFDVDRRCGLETTHGRTYCHPDLFEPVSNYLFRNNGDGTFTDVSESSGIQAHEGKGLGVAFADFDADGHIDIAVANDSFPQFLFQNNGDGTFSEVALLAGAAFDDDGGSFAGMGISFGDLDDDGLPDILTTTLSQERYALFFNRGGGNFQYGTALSELGRVTQLYTGWGLALFDYDNDGKKDVFLANGHVLDNIQRSQPHIRYHQPPLLLRYEEGRFIDVSRQGGAIFQRAWASRGSAAGDLDNDGFVDLVVVNIDGTAYYAGNQGRKQRANNWLALTLEGCGSNRDAIGARVAVTGSDGTKRYAMVTRTEGYLSSKDPRVFFGLGKAAEVRSVEIVWPGGLEQTLPDVTVNQIVHVREPGIRCIGQAER